MVLLVVVIKPQQYSRYGFVDAVAQNIHQYKLQLDYKLSLKTIPSNTIKTQKIILYM